MAKRKPKKRKSERLERRIRYRISPKLAAQWNGVLCILCHGINGRAALQHFRSHGEEMKGVHIIQEWRNPDNKNPKHRAWKTSDDDGQTLEKAFATLHGSMQTALDYEPARSRRAKR